MTGSQSERSTSDTMDSTHIIASAAGVVNYEAYAVEQLAADQVLVRSIVTAVSPGTEVAWINAAPGTPVNFPWTPGYSGVAEVLDVGAEVTSVRSGDMVVARLAHAAEQLVPAEECIVVPCGADYRALSMYRLGGIAMYGVRQGQVQLGDRVVVCGLGPIGLMAAQIARIAGARRVIGVDPLASRRELAQRCGIEAVEPGALPEGYGPRVVIDASGVPAVLEQALQMPVIGGTVVLLGSTRGLINGLDAYTLIHRNGVSVVGAHEYFRPSWCPQSSVEEDELVVDLILQGRLETALLISSINDPADCAKVYTDAREKSQDTMVPLYDWSKA